MNPNHAYATARQLIDPTLTTPSTSAPTTAGHSPPTPVTGNYPAWTSSWPPAGSLRPRPAGHVQSTSPDTLDIRTGDGRLRLLSLQHHRAWAEPPAIQPQATASADQWLSVCPTSPGPLGPCRHLGPPRAAEPFSAPRCSGCSRLGTLLPPARARSPPDVVLLQCGSPRCPLRAPHGHCLLGLATSLNSSLECPQAVASNSLITTCF